MRRRTQGASRQAATGGPFANGWAKRRLVAGGVSRSETVVGLAIGAPATIDSGEAGAATGAAPQQKPRQVHEGLLPSGSGWESP